MNGSPYQIYLQTQNNNHRALEFKIARGAKRMANPARFSQPIAALIHVSVLHPHPTLHSLCALPFGAHLPAFTLIIGFCLQDYSSCSITPAAINGSNNS
jgi:hypothetical protein